MHNVGACPGNAASFFLFHSQASFSVADYPLRHSAILDTGTTLHIFNEVSRFLDLRTARTGDFVWAGERKIAIQAYGTVDIVVQGPKRQKQLMRLYNVALCPTIVCNLVSYQLLERKGIWWDTRPQYHCLRNLSNNSILAYIDRCHEQYVLEHIPNDLSRATFFARRNRFNTHVPRRASKALGDLWHLRLGHPGPRALEHLVNHSRGVRIKGPTTVECDDCGLAKAKRHIRRAPRHIPGDLKPGACLAVDFHDYESDEKGFRALMLVTDRCSGFIWDFYLKSHQASAIVACLAYLVDLLERQYSFKPKVIEADNEFGSKEVHDFLNARHIILEPSAPYTQDQNGGAERSGGVIKEKSRAMRGKLPAIMWREYTRAAVYLFNRTPRYSNSWKTPYEVLFGRKPAQEHLKAYGCKTFAMTNTAKLKKNRRQRLEPKAWLGYLVGYTSTNIYRIWVPIEGRVINTRDVAFNENEFFNGDLSSLQDEAKDKDLATLAQLLQDVSLPDNEDVPLPSASVGSSNTFEDDDIFEVEEEEEKPSEQPQEEPSGLPQEEGDANNKFQPILTPPESPPAALMAASLPSLEPSSLSTNSKSTHAALHAAPARQDITWRAAFMAGTQGNAVAKVDGRNVSRAKLQKLLSTPSAKILSKDLPPPPNRHAELHTHPLGPLFEEAEKAHLQSHKDMNSWLEVGIFNAKGHKILECMWVYTYKFDKQRRLQKCKARLVIRGDQQARSNEDTYAATLAGKSFRTLLAIAAKADLDLIQYDAINAFVNASLNEEVYMRMPAGYRKPGTVLRIKKALYGLRKSPLLWQKELTGTLKSLGFKLVPHEPCCLTKNGIIVFFYVDDMVFAFPRRAASEAADMALRLKGKYRLTGGKDLDWFLGMEVIRDRSKGLIWLSQHSYIDKISGLADSQPRCETPMGTEELRPHDGLASAKERRRYQVKVGSLLYAAVTSRPDIAFGVSRLARFMTNPSQEHHDAADRVLCYLRKHSGLALQFGGGDDFEVASDASFADNTIDRKSSQAYAMKLFGGLVGWRANKQTTVTTSTTEAELLALSQATKESLYMSRLFKELSVCLEGSRITIQCDNQQTIRLVTSEVATLKTQLRHVDIHNHWLRQEVQRGAVSVIYTESAALMADGLTKSLQGPRFKQFVQQLGMIDVTDRLKEHQLAELKAEDLQDRFEEESST